MTATIDKFGRILIPKKIRDELGATAGTEISFKVNHICNRLEIDFQKPKNYEITANEWGWPVIQPLFPVEKLAAYSIPDFINEAREERANVIDPQHD